MSRFLNNEILKGVGSVMSLYRPSRKRYSLSKRFLERKDQDQLKRDWERVGQDIYNAVKIVSQTHER